MVHQNRTLIVKEREMGNYNGNRKKNYRKNFLFFFLALLFFGCFYPSYYNQFWFGISGAIVSLVLALIWLMFILMMKDIRHIKLPLREFTLLLFLAFLYQCFRLIFYGENKAFSEIFEIFVIWLGIFFTMNSFKTETFMKYFYGWHILMFLSIVIGIILFAMGIYFLLDVEEIKGHSSRIMINYGFFFSKSSLSWFKEGDFIRPAGWYDEPGSLAYVVMFLLIYNKLKLKSVKLEYILLFGGMLTLSLAHIITSIVYVLFFKLNNRQTLLGLSFFFLVFLGGYFWEPTDGFGVYVKRAVYGRFEKVIEGDDASRDYSASLIAFRENIWSGGEYDELRTKYPDATAETLYFVLAQHGVIGIIFYLFPILYLFYFLTNRKELTVTQLKLLFILLLNFGQRPFIYYPIFFLMIYFIWFDIEPKKNKCLA
ncbi:MAG TPA: hypothetical protein DHV19_00520 [Bacteroides cellulosilyticus]|nr:hypothetical protein [Bacteroides cellulosilyticus]